MRSISAKKVQIYCKGFTETVSIFGRRFSDILTSDGVELGITLIEDPSTLTLYEPTFILCLKHSRLESDIIAATEGLEGDLL